MPTDRQRQHRRPTAFSAGREAVEGLDEAPECHYGEECRGQAGDGDDDGSPGSHGQPPSSIVTRY